MTDTINRQNYWRLFRGTHQAISDTGPWDLIGAVFDHTYMPALVIDPGYQAYYSLPLTYPSVATLDLPENYDPATQRLYVALRSTANLTVTFSSLTFGMNNKFILKGTDSDEQGEHAGLWTFQGDMLSLSLSAVNGAGEASVQVFMYTIPDLTDFESYYDKQIGLGYSGATPDGPGVPMAVSRVVVKTLNGRGSTNTSTIRFATTVVNTGDDITYADSATLGGSFTINTTGLYFVNLVANSASAIDLGVTVDSTASPGSLDYGSTLISFTNGSAGTPSTCSGMSYLTAGAVVRAAVSAVALTSGALYTGFTIVKIY